jgi:CheY-like chemotaxis protein
VDQLADEIMIMKLMIVDDHAGVRNMIRPLLGSPDDSVVECALGEDAVKVARDFKPDYVTMDIRLPDLSGLEAARAIRAIHPPSRIVIVTSYDQPFLRQAAREAVAFAYVVKDNLAELRSLLVGGSIPPARPSFASGKESESARTTDPVNPVSPGSSSTLPTQPSTSEGRRPTPSKTVVKLRVLMVDDNSNDCELIHWQLKRCGFEPLIKRVEDRAEMLRALEQESWDILFTDCRLPRFSGTEALDLLREIGLHLPTICVTGSPDPRKLAETLVAGACDVIDKNNLTPLCNAVTRVLDRRAA